VLDFPEISLVARALGMALRHALGTTDCRALLARDVDAVAAEAGEATLTVVTVRAAITRVSIVVSCLIAEMSSSRWPLVRLQIVTIGGISGDYSL
jgi:hypothetical protein